MISKFERCLTVLSMKETKIKTKLRLSLTQVSMTIIKKTGECLQECMEREILTATMEINMRIINRTCIYYSWIYNQKGLSQHTKGILEYLSLLHICCIHFVKPQRK